MNLEIRQSHWLNVESYNVIKLKVESPYGVGALEEFRC